MASYPPIVRHQQYAYAHEWTYQNQKLWPPQCKGHSQSPIELPSKNAVKTYFSDLNFDSTVHTKNPIILTNSGHTVETRFANSSMHPTVSGGGLSGEYVLEGFHFHWPSEHKVPGHKFPLEGHFVFYAKKHQSIKNALKAKNGVAALGVFYKLQKGNNPAFAFLNNVENIAHRADEGIYSDFDVALADLLPIGSKFYRYYGSLTTPNCNEVVVWTVFMKPLHIGKQQFNQLRKIWDKHNKLLKFNNRQIQKLNGRKVYVGV
ncbi:hypothetical protein Zmor_016086 [Zophobas morio]|uniref:Carbonic anhydrase n=1 Tax=Zophobas morio TaxID=2755281 RepID=A0AA38MHR3_9CUCU|nr:hypothetical protein Zmor_016086 [Zophobas morio]